MDPIKMWEAMQKGDIRGLAGQMYGPTFETNAADLEAQICEEEGDHDFDPSKKEIIDHPHDYIHTVLYTCTRCGEERQVDEECECDPPEREYEPDDDSAWRRC